MMEDSGYLTGKPGKKGIMKEGTNAFLDCTSLKKVVLPKGTVRRPHAFSEGTKVVSAKESEEPQQIVSEEMDIYDVLLPSYPINGMAYEGRIERIEHIVEGEKFIIKADYQNPWYSPVAIEVFNLNGGTLGYIEAYPERLCAITKFMDELEATVKSVTLCLKEERDLNTHCWMLNSSERLIDKCEKESH